MSCVLGYILLILTNSCPRRDNLQLRNFYCLKNCSFLGIENLLLFPRNPFHASHPEEYQWFHGGPREILEVLRNSREFQRLEGVSRVVGIPEGPEGPRKPRGLEGPGVPGLGPTFLPCRGPRPAILLKKRLRLQVFSCEFCNIFKNTFFTEHLRATTSEVI